MKTTLQALFLLPLLTSCAIEPDGTSTAEDEIVGGFAATGLRPEVGTLWLGAGGCTGTLISPRVVITASHCLQPAYTATTATPGSWFQLTDASGAAVYYYVDKVISFNPQGDVALVHLDSAVPESIAVPAQIAAFPTITYDRVTTFGFGCNAREPEAGWGMKRYLQFVYGIASNGLCHGDSGGPAVFGYASQRGAIWGINSSWGPDRFALTSYLKTQIEDVMHDWDGNLEVGADRPGMDYATVSTKTASSCSTLCRADGNCRSFSWDSQQWKCYLKDGIPDLVPTAGITSGIPSTIEVSYDRPGYDYELITGTTVPQCQARCANDLHCHAWTFVDGGSCYLKDHVPAGQPNGSTASGVNDRAVEAGYDRPGGDLRSVLTPSARQCSWECANDASCKAYTWSHSSHACYLKSAVYPAVASANYDSGVRRGMNNESQRTGTTLRTFTTLAPLWPSATSHSPTTANPFVCQSACAADSACTSWSFALDDGYGGTCRLLSGTVGVGTTAARTISGVKGMEFLR